VGTKQVADRLALIVERSPRRRAEAIGGRDQEAVGELGTTRLREKGIDIALLDRVAGVIRLRLDRPEAAVVLLGDEVDPGVGRPGVRPL
jgi:hypothetical protein